jgi:hypothetical protein
VVVLPYGERSTTHNRPFPVVLRQVLRGSGALGALASYTLSHRTCLDDYSTE